MNICILVSYDKTYEPLARYSVYDNINKYCELHNYQLHIDYQDVFNNGRPPQWRKIQAAMEILPHYDWVFFLDADCLIMNSDIKLESCFYNYYNFFFPAHFLEPIDTPITTIDGVKNIISSQFFVKNNKEGMGILQAIWQGTNNTFDYEGRQIRVIINENKYNIGIVEERRLNTFWYANNPFMLWSYPGFNDNVWKYGDFIVHVTGYKTHEKIQLLSDLNYFSKLSNNEI
jgi:hypothetical protein